MYSRLSALRGQFAYLHQGSFNRGYEGRVVGLDPDTLELQVYCSDGTPKARVILPINTITSISLGYKELEELSLRVMWAHSPDEIAVEDEALADEEVCLKEPDYKAMMRYVTGEPRRKQKQSDQDDGQLVG